MNNQTKKITALVTGVGGGGLGRQVLKALKASSLPYRIITTDMLPTAMGLYEADKYFILPPASDENYISKSLKICKDEKVDVLIPGSEQELEKISIHRKEFENQGILLLINRAEVIETCMDKWETYKFFRKNNLECPESHLIESKEDTAELKNFPLVVKPAVGGRGSANVFIAQDKEELDFYVKQLLKQGLRPLVQEYVGAPDQEYTIGVLTDLNGELIGSIAIKRHVSSSLSNRIKVKNRSKENQKNLDVLMLSSGLSQGRVDDYPEIRKQAENVASKLGSKGPLNIQCRNTSSGISVFEINPRFSGTTSLRALVGYNGPDILIRKHLLGEKITRPLKYKTGVIVRGLEEKLLDL